MSCLIFDCNYLCYQAKYAIKERLVSSTGLYTHIIYGFLLRIRHLANHFETKKLVFVWDSKESKRRDIYPDYKRSRKERKLTKEDIQDYAQFDALREWILPDIGFKNVFHFDGLEADDLIASITKNPTNYKHRSFIVVTSDEDLFQLIRQKGAVSLFNPQKKKGYTYESFTREYGIVPSDWIKVKAYAGCSTDNVEGLAGVGPKTVIDFLTGKLIKGKKFDALISEEAEEIYERNLKLVKLPFENTPVIDLDFSSEKLKMKKFLDVCHKLDFGSFVKDLPELLRWKKDLGLLD